MKHTHCQIKIIDSKEVDEFARKYCRKGWRYAFIKYPEDEIILSEVSLVDEQGGYCPASEDIVDKKIFDEIVKKDKNWYNGMSWDQYRSKIFKDLLFPIEMEC